MRELPNVGDRVRVPFWPKAAEGYVARVEDLGRGREIMVNVKVDSNQWFRLMYRRDQVEVIEPRKPFVEPLEPMESLEPLESIESIESIEPVQTA